MRKEYAKALFQSNFEFTSSKNQRLGTTAFTETMVIQSSESEFEHPSPILPTRKRKHQSLGCQSLQNDCEHAMQTSTCSVKEQSTLAFQCSDADLEPQSPSLLDPKAFCSDYITGTTPDNTSTESSSFKWNTNTIKLLLDIRLAMEKEFCTPSCKKRKLWEKAASQMNSILGSNKVSADMCDSKYRNLLGTYRANKRKQNSTGESAIKWEFFETMDETLGHKASSAPPKNLLGCTVDLGTSDEVQHPEYSSEDDTAVESDASSSKLSALPKRQKKEELSLRRYLFLKFQKDKEKQLEQKEREDRKWAEKKELKLKEIQAINNLAEAITSSSNRK